MNRYIVEVEIDVKGNTAADALARIEKALAAAPFQKNSLDYAPAILRVRNIEEKKK